MMYDPLYFIIGLGNCNTTKKDLSSNIIAMSKMLQKSFMNGFYIKIKTITQRQIKPIYYELYYNAHKTTTKKERIIPVDMSSDHACVNFT